MADHSTPSQAKINHLRLRHLRLAQGLVQAGSLHKAAAMIHVSQPTASAMLKELEQALGGELFERTRKGVKPSFRGGAALARLAALLGQLDTLSEEMTSPDLLPTVRIGCLYSTFFGPLQEYLADFIAAGRCRVELTDGPHAELMQGLQRGELDCVLARMPVNSDGSRRTGYFCQPLHEVATCVLAGPNHPLARRRRLDLRDLSSYEWILPKTATVLRDAFATAGLPPPKVRIQTSSFLLSLSLLRISDLLTTAPRDAGIAQERLGLATVLRIDLPQLLPPVAFVAQQASMLNPYVVQLWDAVRRATEDPKSDLRRRPRPKLGA